MIDALMLFAAILLAIGLDRMLFRGKHEDKTALGEAKTHELVAELEKREGVDARRVEPYERTRVHAEGPAVVLIVTD